MHAKGKSSDACRVDLRSTKRLVKLVFYEFIFRMGGGIFNGGVGGGV